LLSISFRFWVSVLFMVDIVAIGQFQV